jgi:hypothetical protein
MTPLLKQDLEVTVIDRPAREHLALLLRRLADGRISNDDFDDNYAFKSPDSGVQAVAEEGWALYGDYWTYRLRGHHALARPVLRRVAQSILFLHSDCEYEWPAPPRLGPAGKVLAVLTLGRFDMRHHDGSWTNWLAAGDFTVWPFLRWSAFERACAAPRYLRGHSSAAA